MFSFFLNIQNKWTIVIYRKLWSEVSVGKHTLPFLSVLLFFQIAYLENLLKVYNEEIQRLQQAELSLDELEKEESLYIQEHKLKRKVSLESGAACGCAGSE